MTAAVARRSVRDMNNPKTDLAQLLARLERNDGEALRRTLVGRSLGKTEDSLHLATATGIVAIPLDQIESIREVHEGIQDHLEVSVKRADSVVALLRTQNVGRGSMLGGGASIYGGLDGTLTLDDPKDTATLTNGPQADQTDDYFPGGVYDDDAII
jgi:hypothetical protein